MLKRTTYIIEKEEREKYYQQYHELFIKTAIDFWYENQAVVDYPAIEHGEGLSKLHIRMWDRLNGMIVYFANEYEFENGQISFEIECDNLYPNDESHCKA